MEDLSSWIGKQKQKQKNNHKTKHKIGYVESAVTEKDSFRHSVFHYI